MQLVICMLITLLIGSPAIAAECKTELTGLVVYFSSREDDWSISWKADGVHKEKISYYVNRKDGIRTNVHDSRYNYAKSLPQTLLVNTMDQQQTVGECEPNPGNEFNVPFDISQNGALLIAAIYNRKSPAGIGPSYPSQKFGIVDLKKNRLVNIVGSRYSVRSLAWAPSDKYFAVLYKQDVTDQVFKGPIDWLASMAGHPIGYWTFYLTLYQSDGTPVCTTQVAKKLPNAMGYIDWEKQ